MAVESEDINSSSPPIKKTKSSKPGKFKYFYIPHTRSLAMMV